jgi:hypothetical protein
MTALHIDFIYLVSKDRTRRPTVWDYYPDREAAERGRLAISPSASFGGPEDYEAIPVAEFHERQRAFYLRDIEPISAETWIERLEVLPPYRWERADGVERFMLSEFLDGPFTHQYARRGKHHFTRIVNADDPSTWITGAMIDEYLARNAGGTESQAEDDPGGLSCVLEIPETKWLSNETDETRDFAEKPLTGMG